MNIYTIGIVCVAVVCIIIYFMFTATPVSVSNTSVDGPFSLESKVSVLKASNFLVPAAALNFLKQGKGTFHAYIYLDSLSQTGSMSDCGTRQNQPSCSSGLYDPCSCTSSVDCTNCTHAGYKNLVSLYGVYNLEVLPFPDASRPNTVSTQLAVQTQTAKQTYIETIPLPPIPLQKWVMLTISKSGRRIDVYYNDLLVSSTTMLNMISTMQPSGSIVQAGDSTLSGKIGVISMNGESSTIGSVASRFSSTSDSRGAPTKFAISLTSYTNDIKPVSTGGILNALCLDGSCLNLPRVGNASVSLSQFSDSLSGLSNSSKSVRVSPCV